MGLHFMAGFADFKSISKSRLKTVEILIDGKDWDGAAYMMGLTLECALKAVICKTLHLTSYPENTRNNKIDDYFMTHKFDQLLTPSGMEDIFSVRGKKDIFRSWSEFTKEYQGDWPTMRYDRQRQGQFDEEKVKKLYNNLVSKPCGIITVISSEKRW
jgi:hypothetical protein